MAPVYSPLLAHQEPRCHLRLEMPVLDPAAIVLATLAVSILLFATDAVRYDLVALIVVLVLALTGTLTPQEAFAGLASDPVILIASMTRSASMPSGNGSCTRIPSTAGSAFNRSISDRSSSA